MRWRPAPSSPCTPSRSLEPLVLPLIVAFGLGVVYLLAIVALMHEDRVGGGIRAIGASVRAVPSVIADGIGLLRGSRVLLALVSVELFWGFSMVAFESLFPIRLAELVGGTQAAGGLMGPVSSGAWFASAAGSAAIGLLSQRIGVARSAALLRVLQGATILAMGLAAGPVGAITAFIASYVTHGASNPMHTTLLHREVEGPRRATVLSMNSMVGLPAAALGSIVLATLADGYVGDDGDGRRRDRVRGGGPAVPAGAAGGAAPTGARTLPLDCRPMPPSDQVTVGRPADAAAFLAEAGPFLADREAEHNLPLGLAANLVVDPDALRRDTVLRGPAGRCGGRRRGDHDAAVRDRPLAHGPPSTPRGRSSTTSRPGAARSAARPARSIWSATSATLDAGREVIALRPGRSASTGRTG